MDQIKPEQGTQRRRLGACCWKVTAAAAVVGSTTALCLGILLGESAATYKETWSALLIAKIPKILLPRTKFRHLSALLTKTTRAVVSSCSQYVTLEHFIFSVS